MVFWYIVVLWVPSIQSSCHPWAQNCVRCHGDWIIKQKVSGAKPEPGGTGHEVDLNPRSESIEWSLSAHLKSDFPSSGSSQTSSASISFSIHQISPLTRKSFHNARPTPSRLKDEPVPHCSIASFVFSGYMRRGANKAKIFTIWPVFTFICTMPAIQSRIKGNIWVNLRFSLPSGWLCSKSYIPRILYHFDWFGHHMSQGLWSWLNSVTCPVSQPLWPTTFGGSKKWSKTALEKMFSMGVGHMQHFFNLYQWEIYLRFKC